MNEVIGLVQFIISAVTFGVLLISFFVNISFLEEKRTMFRKFKVGSLAVAFLLFLIFYKDFFKYAIVFTILGILSTRKIKWHDKKSTSPDSRELG